MRLRFLSVAGFALALAAPLAAHADDTPLAIDDHSNVDYSALAEIFPNGMPDLVTSGSFTSRYRLPSHIKPAEKKKIPTRIEYADGPLKWEIGTNISTRQKTTSIIPTPKDPYIEGGAAGAGGEIKGQIRYATKEWELYGAQTFGSYQGDGVQPTFHDTTMIGSLYKLPDWMAGGRIGASFELYSDHNSKTRIEYRQPLGGAEAYIAAEQFRSAGVDPSPPSIRAGVNRKF